MTNELLILDPVTCARLNESAKSSDTPANRTLMTTVLLMFTCHLVLPCHLCLTRHPCSCYSFPRFISDPSDIYIKFAFYCSTKIFLSFLTSLLEVFFRKLVFFLKKHVRCVVMSLGRCVVMSLGRCVVIVARGALFRKVVCN